MQVNSFVGKFIALWASHKDVSLTLSAKDGKAKAILDMDLGDFTESSNVHPGTKEDYSSVVSGTSRQRRIDRRSKENNSIVSRKN